MIRAGKVKIRELLVSPVAFGAFCSKPNAKKNDYTSAAINIFAARYPESDLKSKTHSVSDLRWPDLLSNYTKSSIIRMASLAAMRCASRENKIHFTSCILDFVSSSHF